MLAQLKLLYDKAESLKGKKLVEVLLVSFVVFLVFGLLIGYVISTGLNKNEDLSSNPVNVVSQKPETIYKGKIVYVNPNFYPGEDVSYALEDSSGKILYLLKINCYIPNSSRID